MKKLLLAASLLLVESAHLNANTSETLINSANFSPNQPILLTKGMYFPVTYKQSVNFTPAGVFNPIIGLLNKDGSMTTTYEVLKSNIAGKLIIDGVTYTYEINK